MPPAGRGGRAPRLTSSPSGSTASPPTQLRPARPAAPSVVAVMIAWPMPATRAPGSAGGRVELREHVVEQEQRRARRRRAAPPRRAGATSTASRCSPCEPKLRRSRVAAGDDHVVEMRAEAGDAALEVTRRAAPRAPRQSAARRRSAARLRQPELAGTLREPRREQRERLRRASTSDGTECGDLLGPRLQRVCAGTAELHAAKRRVALRHAPPIVLRQRRASGRRAAPSTRSKYARRAAGPPLTTARRSGVKTSVATSRRSDSADGSSAPFSRASFAWPARSVSVTSSGELPRVPVRRRARRRSPKRINWASCRVRGEKPWVATCSDSSRFVLPTPFGRRRARGPARAQLERRVRAVVAERDPSDDQATRSRRAGSA